MNYNEALGYIHGTPRFKKEPEHKSIRTLLTLLGEPQKKLKFIHVAGTNGKGSTCTCISEILRAEGLRVGLFTSPYVYEFTERMRINGQEISHRDLAECTLTVKEKIDEIKSREGFKITEFEIVTAVSLVYFVRQKCDVVVFEVGIGGRLDPTNVIDVPDVAVIAHIDIDHSEYLGDAVEKIAFEKCGIIKGGTVVSYPRQWEDAACVIRKVCAKRNAQLNVPDASSLVIKEMGLGGTSFDFMGYAGLKIKLLGVHQAYNAITAICAAIEFLKAHGIKLSEIGLRKGLENTYIAGRFEVLSENPLVIIDGAHNVDGVRAFCDCVKLYVRNENTYKERKIIIVAAMLKGKDYESAIPLLAKISDVFIATEARHEKTVPCDELAKIAEKYCDNVMTFKSHALAIEKARELPGSEDALCVCGSIYLLSALRL